MYKLLVVDDDSESRTTLCSCFPWDSAGFEVTAQLSIEKLLQGLTTYDNQAVLVVDGQGDTTIYWEVFNLTKGHDCSLKILSSYGRGTAVYIKMPIGEVKNS